VIGPAHEQTALLTLRLVPQVAALPFLAFGLVLAFWMPVLILQATPVEDASRHSSS
jgi:hypothetical protein